MQELNLKLYHSQHGHQFDLNPSPHPRDRERILHYELQHQAAVKECLQDYGEDYNYNRTRGQECGQLQAAVHIKADSKIVQRKEGRMRSLWTWEMRRSLGFQPSCGFTFFEYWDFYVCLPQAFSYFLCLFYVLRLLWLSRSIFVLDYCVRSNEAVMSCCIHIVF